MAVWLIAAVERLPPRARRMVLAAAAVLLLVGAITSLTFEARPGGGARRRAPVGVSAVAPGASSSSGAAGEPTGFGRRDARCPRRRCAVPRLVSAVCLRPRKRWSGEGCHARAAQPADLAARSGHAGRARPSPAGCLAGHGRNDARVRRGDGDYRGRRDRGVPAAVHAQEQTGRWLVSGVQEG